MNKELLIKILEVPTYTGREEKIKEFLVDYFNAKGYKHHTDKKSNLYVHKKSSRNRFVALLLGKRTVEYYPCVCAHLDTVYKHMIKFIDKDIKKVIKEKNNKLYACCPNSPNQNQRIGLGGDDLAGIYLCLEMLEEFDDIKAAFFVEEEIGAVGALNCDEEFLKDVGYFIEFDAPTNNWYTETLGTEKIYSDEFHSKVEDILEDYNITNFTNDISTDIEVVRDKFQVSSCNLPTGYFNQHGDRKEYVDLTHIDDHIQLGKDYINRLGHNRYHLEAINFDNFDEYLEERKLKNKKA